MLLIPFVAPYIFKILSPLCFNEVKLTKWSHVFFILIEV